MTLPSAHILPFIVLVFTALVPMPAHGDRTMLQFNATKTRELHRFFDNLQYILNHVQVTSQNEMKCHAVRYMDINTSKLWETLVEFTDPTKTFAEFKTTLQDLYPGSQEEHKWTVADMDQLIGEWLCLGIISQTMSRIAPSLEVFWLTYGEHFCRDCSSRCQIVTQTTLTHQKTFMRPPFRSYMACHPCPLHDPTL